MKTQFGYSGYKIIPLALRYRRAVVGRPSLNYQQPIQPFDTSGRTALGWKVSILTVCAAVFASAVALMPSTAHAQYPNKPIRLLVPFAPGGSSEIVSRAYGAEMAKVLGQPIIVENKPGGAGNIAMVEAKNADKDGYTIILGHVGTLAVNPPMFGAKLPYDPVKDFAPVTLLSKVPSLIVVNASVAAKDLKEFVALAKAKPGTINYGSAGNGSSGHLAMAYFNQVAGIDTQHVPYKGTGPMLSDILGGRLEATFTGAPPLLPHVKAGKLRAIAVGTSKRIAALPDVPTVAEQGFAGFETSQWYGLLVPVGTPDAIIKKLADAAAVAAKTPGVAERLAAEAAEPVTMSPKEFGEYIGKEMKRWDEVVRKGNIKAD